ncbi:hypothetical protein A3F62_05270 [Candidatus Woesebacteria bacterium RIFCSPHIGHO2_12_FULL_44_11]|uniref:Uncharacterized protein n=1 Tax=Candidatus Woesebacteria bacterium RIFCSPLOWO2_01_FULL_44_14 TaxID=1802525 RepID=A0A1F8C111_9BACT|nr:MAG: hypothetical protein A3F62_05270 [Candidatus Woesebacteria bacterium RIFCSPHIGHO2_12_FULL_44_11]OGM69509.1 MAG: hypothetical protein A2975_03085 [Candidatus Woesebacteria bacterium RIFCSPLOWO2_01_FULL_44_14]
MKVMGHMFSNNYGGNWEGLPDYMQQMMKSYYGGLQPFGAVFGIFHLVSWVLVILILVALFRLVWKRGSK